MLCDLCNINDAVGMVEENGKTFPICTECWRGMGGAVCAVCEKPFVRDQYNIFCNKCGAELEREIREM
jgi:exosome complex RNA-binding protein Csl4